MWSLRWGRKAPANPWRATGLELQSPSTPPTHNFEHLPTVDREPYEYHRKGYVDNARQIAGDAETPQKSGEQE
jgi:cytochrome c oxidase subunit 1